MPNPFAPHEKVVFDCLPEKNKGKVDDALCRRILDLHLSEQNRDYRYISFYPYADCIHIKFEWINSHSYTNRNEPAELKLPSTETKMVIRRDMESLKLAFFIQRMESHETWVKGQIRSRIAQARKELKVVRENAAEARQRLASRLKEQEHI